MALKVASEGLAGGLGPLDAAPFHLDYRLRVAIETETGFAADSRAPTTVDVVGQVLGQGWPTSNHLTDGCERWNPGFGLRQLRRAGLARVGLAVAREGLTLLFTHTHLLVNNPTVDLFANPARTAEQSLDHTDRIRMRFRKFAFR